MILIVLLVPLGSVPGAAAVITTHTHTGVDTCPLLLHYKCTISTFIAHFRGFREVPSEAFSLYHTSAELLSHLVGTKHSFSKKTS